MMNKGKVIALAIALVVVISAFVVLGTERPVSGGPTPNGNDPNNDGETPATGSSTSIAAIATAVGYWENITSYDWTLTKAAGGELAQVNNGNPALKIKPGETATAHFDITATKSVPNFDQTDVARGLVTVNNTGGSSTEGLAISVVIQGFVGNEWVDLAAANVSTEGAPVLSDGNGFAYAYEVAFEGGDITEFRTVATATITNFAGHVGEAYGAEAASDDFALPGEITYVVLNDEAYLTDLFVVPEGFTYEVINYDGPWTINAGQTFAVDYSVTNVDNAGDLAYILNNQARLSLNDTGEEVLANAQIKVFTHDFETSLYADTDARIVQWTEYAEFELEIAPENFVNITGGSPLDGAEPLNVTGILVIDDNHFVIEGTVTVTNTGYHATYGLGLTYYVYLVRGTEWIEIGSVTLNLAEHPELEACETYTYPFSAEVNLDGTPFGTFGSIYSAQLLGVVKVSASNLDGNPDDLADVSPLWLPQKQDVLTVVTKVTSVGEQTFDLPLAGQYAWIGFANQLSFEQTLVITNNGGQTAVSSQTEIHAVTVVTYSNCRDEVVSAPLTNDYVHYESAFITGDGRTLVLREYQESTDADSLEVCVLAYDAPLNISSVLAYAGLSALYDGDGVYVLSNSQALYYGVSGSIGWPEIPVPEPPAVEPPAEELPVEEPLVEEPPAEELPEAEASQ